MRLKSQFRDKVLEENKFSKKSNFSQGLNPRPYDYSISSPIPILLW